ncbi:hypothetical protein N7474_004943 [Penicillium riverlandense]|uniref:uncharacterized protein n=1 Tax=Penicillium riverlandense TaxID=1903569 RepID=UPI0025499E83|nr:uncharacterized protein N7474_004943 [Penicillium riverlandense]KAJ5819352.1 hypothetical protein N7474_004943 [Penicillium riverlandense]
MKRFLRLNRRESEQESPSGSDSEPSHPGDSPEGIILKEITAFCETSGAPQHGSTAGNEFVHLPLIVETAESSPGAAKEAAHRIRRYLSAPDKTPNHVQYNSIMLMRILVDNPGHTFTRNIDSKFVATIKIQLRQGRDWHVQHYLRQYLTTLETQRHWDQDLTPLLQMWSKEKHRATSSWTDRRPMGGSYLPNPQQPQYQNQNYYSRPQAPRNVLPGPDELAARVSESRNSAKLLTQFVQSTPPTEMESNDLIKEFTDRCRTASRVISGYMQATNPAPDDETLLTLIETNDELSVALSQQQRALLKARKARGSVSQSPNNNSSGERSPQSNNNNHYAVASGAIGPMAASAAPRLNNDVPSPLIDMDDAAEPAPSSRPTAPRTTSQRYEYNSDEFQVQNPFADDFATNDSDSNHPHSTTTKEPNGPVGVVATEQER